MAKWIIKDDKYNGHPRWYTCPICRYTYDDTIDHVSESDECPNCRNKMNDDDAYQVVIRDHLLVIAGARAAYMDCAGAIHIETSVQGEEDMAKFITSIVNRYCELDQDMNFDEYIENNLIYKYQKGDR